MAARVGVCVGMWNIWLACTRKSRGISVSTTVCQAQFRCFDQSNKTGKGESSQNTTGGDGRGEIGFTCTPFAGRDTVDHGDHKPDGKYGQAIEIELVNSKNGGDCRDHGM